jgi:hypothetical protein
MLSTGSLQFQKGLLKYDFPIHVLKLGCGGVKQLEVVCLRRLLTCVLQLV